ncbi:MAG: MBL fold metallo-hydrolase [Terracidiphilus sp.]|jgi:phosphoribosyl 1,2-cyclic phosphodiesterase
MVRFTVLASGSKGNCTVISGGRTRILLDAGLSCRELFRRMRLAGEEPETLDAVIITHEHSDHVNGLAVTARKLGIPVYFTEGTHRAWMRWLTPRRQMTYAQWLEQCRKQAAERQAETDAAGLECEPDESDLVEAVGELGEEHAAGAKARVDQTASTARLKSCPDTKLESSSEPGLDSSSEPKLESSSEPELDTQPATPSRKEDPTWLPTVEYFEAGKPFEIGDIAISPFTIPHDAADPVGFVFQAEGVRMGYATDLGYIPPNVKEQLKGVDLLMLESNHDLEMLRDGPYPWQVKQRVLSRVGHLSNEAAAAFLEEGYDGQAAYVILAHLSESNNLPDLARVTAERALSGRASLLANRLLLAMQYEGLSGIQF